MKFTFIGAGSFIFTRRFITDMLTFPALQDSTFTLFDINEERLGYIKQGVELIIAEGKYPARVEATLDRAEAFQGADGVIISILQGGIDVWRKDIEIPLKHGVNVSVGDSMGPSGTFRALRTIPVMLDIARDIERHCPDAIVLNYSNPMSMISGAVQKHTGVKLTGLCHSVQGTSAMLAKWIGAPLDEITYLCFGINHQAWFKSFQWNGKDAYPLVRQAIESREGVRYQELVRNDMFLHFGYYVTESSSHNSEYCAWYRKRPDLIEKWCHNYETEQGYENRALSSKYADKGWNYGRYANTLIYYMSREDRWREDIQESLQRTPDLARGNEYAGYIFNALMGDGTMFEFNGNVLNHGAISNLPSESCVEIPIVASRAGLRPIQCGDLPAHLAILANTHARAHDIIVEASMEGDREKVYHALYFDPLTSACLSLEETRSMVDEMFEANASWLPQFK